MRTYRRVSHCKRILFTSTMCWGSVLLSCHECLSNCHFDNIYYTSYFVNYAKCKHAKTPLVTVSKNGYLFVWLVTFNMDDENAHHGELFFVCQRLITLSPVLMTPGNLRVTATAIKSTRNGISPTDMGCITPG